MHNKFYLSRLLTFLNASPTPFHAVANMASTLREAGFEALDERDHWQLEPQGRYYVIRNDSSILAFSHPDTLSTAGLRLLGAHTDSPCLRLKPRPIQQTENCFMAAVEVYGGALLNPWFDRDLSIAGRVSWSVSGSIQSQLVDFKKPVACVPSLAIHLDRKANQHHSIHNENDLRLLLQLQTDSVSATDPIRHALGELIPALQESNACDYELSCYDSQPAAITGLQEEFVSSARLDNLLSCYVATTTLAESQSAYPALMICTDHEEVGSVSAVGAAGSFLQDILQRLLPDPEERQRCLRRSLLLSADNSHAVHPNFANRHDGLHLPRLNGGPVLKTNTSQRYASNSRGAALFRELCRQQQVPVQNFVSRSDLACGSTIGPITAAETGIHTVDVGIAQLAMHSIREICGATDPLRLHQVFKAFLATEQVN